MGDIMGTVTQTTTNSAVSILKLTVPSQINEVLIHLKELKVNSVTYTILASNDDVTYETLLGTTTLLKDASAYQIVGDSWRFIDIQIAALVGGAQGSVKVVAVGN